MDWSQVIMPFFIPAMLTLAMCCGLHVLCYFLRGGIGRVISYVNIALHVVLFLLLALSYVTLQFLLVCFMGALFVYVLMSFISSKRHPECGDSQEGCEEDAK